MIKLGLIGRGISHSRSKEMYEKILGREVDYHLLDYASEAEIPSLIDLFKEGFEGLSITFPYKLTFNDQIKESEVKNITPVNCLKLINEKVCATNTDFLAAKNLMEKEDLGDLNLIVLGSGNMADVFSQVFKELKCDFQQVSRKINGDINSINFEDYAVPDKRMFIINCCSRAFQFTAKTPSGTSFWDMNYSFPEHDHLKERPHFNYREGDDLLYQQAKFALKFWKIQ